MAKFIYRMQSILNIKYKLEEQAKNEFMLANRLLQEEEEKKRRLILRKEGYRREAAGLLAEKLDMLLIKENKRAILRMDELIEAQEKAIMKARRNAQEKARLLTELMRERKVQEKLRERAFEDFLKEENVREGKEVDELVSFTYGKRQREE